MEYMIFGYLIIYIWLYGKFVIFLFDLRGIALYIRV